MKFIKNIIFIKLYIILIIFILDRISKNYVINLFNETQFDEIYLAKRTALACISAFALSKGLVVLDTLMDIDRGDFPRSGLIDRRGNMNMSGRYLTTLLALLGRNASRHSLSIDQILETKTHTSVRFHQGAREFCMYLLNDSQ